MNRETWLAAVEEETKGPAPRNRAERRQKQRRLRKLWEAQNRLTEIEKKKETKR